MKPHVTLTAVNLRIILSILLFVMAGAIGGVFYLGRNDLLKTSDTVNKAVADANVSSQSLDRFKKIEADLKTNQIVMTRSKQLTADLLDYQYQNQIITDLQAYGQQNGITISGVDFGASTTGAAKASTGATMPGGGASTGGDSATNKSVTITITLNNPVAYANLLNFVYAIEQSLPKMQISKLSITGDSKSSTQVTVSDISMQMYVK